MHPYFSLSIVGDDKMPRIPGIAILETRNIFFIKPVHPYASVVRARRMLDDQHKTSRACFKQIARKTLVVGSTKGIFAIRTEFRVVGRV